MIMILAFAAWSLLLAVVGVLTGVAVLMYIATAIGGLAVGFALLVLFIELHSPDPRAARGAAPRSHRAAVAVPAAS
jgi:prepilin signal peptidase PulO-like enzyme (type II secretory pathway)